jgi:hypothetical protein
MTPVRALSFPRKLVKVGEQEPDLSAAHALEGRVADLEQRRAVLADELHELDDQLKRYRSALRLLSPEPSSPPAKRQRESRQRMPSDSDGYISPAAYRVLEALETLGRPVRWNEIAEVPGVKGMHPATLQSGLSKLRRNNLVHQPQSRLWAAGPQQRPD